MGLDMYAYSCARAGMYEDYYENYDFKTESSTSPQPKELAYWRKHPYLHGWMERLWRTKVGEEIAADNSFNGIELELVWADLEALEKAVQSNELPPTEGFFFGDDSCEYYKDTDLAFIRDAKADLFCGLKVFYNSSW